MPAKEIYVSLGIQENFRLDKSEMKLPRVEFGS